MFSERAPRPSPFTPVPARRASPHHTVRCKRCQARCASSHGGVDADRPARRGHQDAVMRCHADSDPVRDVAALAAAPLGRSDLPCRVGRRRRQGGVPDRPPAGIRRPASVSQASKAASSRASAFLSHHPDWLSQDLFVTHPRTVAPPKPDRSRRRPTASHGMYAGRPESNAFPSAGPGTPASAGTWRAQSPPCLPAIAMKSMRSGHASRIAFLAVPPRRSPAAPRWSRPISG
jgi:hypothetical protein